MVNSILKSVQRLLNSKYVLPESAHKVFMVYFKVATIILNFMVPFYLIFIYLISSLKCFP